MLSGGSFRGPRGRGPWAVGRPSPVRRQSTGTETDCVSVCACVCVRRRKKKIAEILPLTPKRDQIDEVLAPWEENEYILQINIFTGIY